MVNITLVVVSLCECVCARRALSTLLAGLEGAGLRLNKSEFRTLMETAANTTREGTVGWDYNHFCNLVSDAGGALEVGGEGEPQAPRGRRERPHSLTHSRHHIINKVHV